MSDPTEVAGIAALATFTSALVAWLMNLSLRTRIALHEVNLATTQAAHAQNLATHEAALKVQADFRLRLHERSWEMLRDLVVAAQACADAFKEWVEAIRKKEAIDVLEQKRMNAAATLVRVDSLASIAPVSVECRTVSTDLENLYYRIEGGEPVDNESLKKPFRSATARFERWNAELWRTIYGGPNG